MHLADDSLIFFATDLSNFLACPQLTLLTRRTALGGPKPPEFDDPALDVLRKRGEQHEQAYLAKLRASGKSIAEIVAMPDVTGIKRWQALHEQTVQAMKAGVDVVYQGTLFNAPWGGRPDFLIKVATPSAFGDWSYEVIDTKLAREAKAGALLQVLLYAQLIERVQAVAPACVHLALAGPEQKYESFRAADYAAYFRAVQHHFESFVANASDEIQVAPEPVEHCGVCAWSSVCDEERHDVDHLSLIAGITSGQRRTLKELHIDTLEAFAEAVPSKGMDRVHGQALIQLQGRREKANKYELLPVVAEQGLAKLPEPNAGDLFFDLEGDPYAHTYGIEYLFGYADAHGNYTAKWALTPEEEQRAFEDFIDFVMARLEQFPDLHIYHYNHYETTALKRLMGHYGTREEEVDRLLRGGVFVDLYRVVKQALRASVESYSIKKLEPFYGYRRDVDLITANRALANFTAFIELGVQDAHLATLQLEIAGYNQDDCVSTLRLRDWLESLRATLIAQTETEIPRPAPQDPEPSNDVKERQEDVARVAALLNDRAGHDACYALMSHLLEFHRREKRQYWFHYFRIRDMVDEERYDERKTLVGLQFVEEVADPHASKRTRSKIYRYRFPEQEQSFEVGKKTINPRTEENAGEVVAIDEVGCTIDLKRMPNGEHPTVIMLDDYVGDQVMRDSLLAFGSALCSDQVGEEYGCAVDLLKAQPLPSRVLAIQGPPGAGKTHTGAHMILDALAAGKRVGVTANSHKVIGNLLEKVCTEAAKAVRVVKGIQKADEDDWCGRNEIECGDNDDLLAALQTRTQLLAAGTAWLWSRPQMIQSVDVLFIDEAGQFSLANALAVAPAAKEIVLLGDPQQLDQPLQGAHPPGAAVSALGHMLGDHATMPVERGIFLDKTWRMHPRITAFTSEVFYDGKLESRPGLERQNVAGNAGVQLITVPHAGNANESVEEAERVALLIQQLLGAALTWTDDAGEPHPLGLNDIVVVAPYNMQVAAIAKRLPGVRVGTVDKFQGQEAPISIYSMATSSAADAPRGMRFLYSPNRFNVATSRAKCIAIVIASPELFMPECKTPEQMKWANAFCRFAEIASDCSEELGSGSRVLVGL